MPRQMRGERLNVAILGASGYTGADLVRLLVRHPKVRIAALAGNAQAGQSMASVYPHFVTEALPEVVKIDDIDMGGIDLVFCALPHGTTQEVIAALPREMPVIDLSADFRLVDPSVYEQWYGKPHAAPALQPEAVYGLTEHFREAVAEARLVACPGCYPTAALLALLPLARTGAIDVEDIVIDAKSGVTGAGRSVRQQNLFSEISDSLTPYGVSHHRHMPEIEQELGRAAGRALKISFTPHLVPMNRGELLTIYVRLSHGRTAGDLKACLASRYASEPFVHVLPGTDVPATRDVRGSNHCLVNVFSDRISTRAIVVSAIDNLVKGSSGQAIQNMNVMYGWPETLALEQVALFP